MGQGCQLPQELGLIRHSSKRRGGQLTKWGCWEGCTGERCCGAEKWDRILVSLPRAGRRAAGFLSPHRVDPVLLLKHIKLPGNTREGKTREERQLGCARDSSAGEQGSLNATEHVSQGEGLANRLLHCSVPQFPLHHHSPPTSSGSS